MCEMCGSNMIKKEGGFYICQACGTKFIAKDSQNDGNYQYNDDVNDQENLQEGLVKMGTLNLDTNIIMRF